MLHNFYCMFICECMCVNIAVRTQKKIPCGAARSGLTRQRQQPKREHWVISLGRTQTSERRKKNVKHASCYEPCACALSSSWIIKGQ